MSLFLEHRCSKIAGCCGIPCPISEVDTGIGVSAGEVRHPMSCRPSGASAYGPDVVQLSRTEIAGVDQRGREGRHLPTAKPRVPITVPYSGHPSGLDAEDHGSPL